jgi:hypothetical protein
MLIFSKTLNPMGDRDRIREECTQSSFPASSCRCSSTRDRRAPSSSYCNGADSGRDESLLHDLHADGVVLQLSDFLCADPLQGIAAVAVDHLVCRRRRQQLSIVGHQILRLSAHKFPRERSPWSLETRAEGSQVPVGDEWHGSLVLRLRLATY